MRLVSKVMQKIARRLRLIRAFAITQWRVDTAFMGNNVVSALSPIFYVASFLIFMNVLFDNITTLAGYSRNEILFLVFVGQFMFYLTDFWGYQANAELHKLVNTGNLDLVLLRPIKSLVAVSIYKIRLMGLVLNLIGPLTPTWWIVDWSTLHLTAPHILAGAAILLMGVFLLHSLQFLLTLPVFWTGWAQESNILIFASTSQTIPLEGMPRWFKFIFTGAFPAFFGSSVAASVMLGKGSAVFWLPIAAGITLGVLIFKRLMWHMALRRYASASS